MSNIVSFNDMQHMAEAIAKSGLFGMKDTNSVLALMAVAQAEGLHPATAARDFHIIQGRPALKADAMLARFQQAGGVVTWKEYTDERVTGMFQHPQGSQLEVTWTIAQAKRIGLFKPGSGWEKYPRSMLRSRCVSEGIRAIFPGAITGFYTPEEVVDFDDKSIKDITPIKTTLEAPSSVSLVDMKDDVIYDPKTSYALLKPDGEVYSFHESVEEWCEGYTALVCRIRDNPKITPKDKDEKIASFRKANTGVMDRFPTDVRMELTKKLFNQPVKEEHE